MFSTKKMFFVKGSGDIAEWDFVARIDPMDASSIQGSIFSSLSLNHDGNLIAIGDKSFDGGSGAVSVFRFQDGSWVDDLANTDGSKLRSVFGSLGRFGHQVRLSRGYDQFAGGVKGEQIIIGEPGNNSASSYFRCKCSSGQNITDWGWNFSVSDSQVDGFGGSVAINGFGNYIAVGCGGDPPSSQTSGLVRLFHKPAINWVQVGQDIIGPENSRMGNNISIKSHKVSSSNVSENPGILLLGSDSLDASVQGFAKIVLCSGQCESWDQSTPNFIDSGNRFFGYFVSMNYESTRIVVSGGGVSKTFDFDGSSWSQFGQAIQGNNAKMCYLGERIAARSSNGVSVFQRDSNDWKLISFMASGENNFADIDLSGSGKVLAAASKSGIDIFKQTGYTLPSFASN